MTGLHSLPPLITGRSAFSGLADGRPPHDRVVRALAMSRTGDKSCGNCKTRKVRCDRSAVACRRCIKRHEESSCLYPPDTVFEDGTSESHEVQDQLRVADLEAQLATLVAELEFQAASVATAPGRGIAATTGPLPDLGSSILFCCAEPSSENACRRFSDYFLGRAGETAGDKAPVGRQLAVALISAFHETCWSRLPAFRPLSDSLSRYDYASPDCCLDDMDPSAQVAIVLLCALGASCKSRSGVFGTAVDLTTAPLADIMDIGWKRESACRKLGDLAWEVAGRVGILWVVPDPSPPPSVGGGIPDDSLVVGVLVGWSQWLTFADFMPVKARWILRNAISLYEDRMTAGHNVNDVGISAGPAIMEIDSKISSRLLSPSLLPPHVAREFLKPASTHGVAPAPSVTHLFTVIVLQHHISKVEIEKAMSAISRDVSECCALFTSIAVQASSYRTEPPALPIRSLWAGIDVVHASVQKLQQTLAAVNYVPVGCETDVEAVDDFILLAVRLDARLVDLCNSVHAFLGRPWVASGVPEGELASMRFDSDRRIRKCLRLAAFYSQFFLSSANKYLVSHLVLQLEVLLDWTTLATQRVGDSPGPSSSEYEVSNQELDWLAVALRSSCFYFSGPALRLNALAAGRGQPLPHDASSIPSRQAPSPAPPPSTASSSLATPSTGTLSLQPGQRDSGATTPDTFMYDTNNPPSVYDPMLSGLEWMEFGALEDLLPAPAAERGWTGERTASPYRNHEMLKMYSDAVEFGLAG